MTRQPLALSTKSRPTTDLSLTIKSTTSVFVYLWNNSLLAMDFDPKSSWALFNLSPCFDNRHKMVDKSLVRDKAHEAISNRPLFKTMWHAGIIKSVC